MATKTYQTTPPKSKSKKITVHVDLINLPSETHRDCRQKCRPVVFEDRRFKKPKYKVDYEF